MRARTKIELPTGIVMADRVPVVVDTSARESPARAWVVKATRKDDSTVEVELEIECDVVAQFFTESTDSRGPRNGLRVGFEDGVETNKHFIEDSQR